jgi:hypothetical protein
VTRVVDAALAAVAYVASTVAGEYRLARLHWRCVRAGHWMREMSDGPICTLCGTFWPWRD